MILLQKMLIFDRSTTFVKESCFQRPRFLSYVFSTIFSHCAVSACSPTHCPGYVELIYGAWYRLIGETYSKIHCEVAPSFPAGVSRVCYGNMVVWAAR